MMDASVNMEEPVSFQPIAGEPSTNLLENGTLSRACSCVSKSLMICFFLFFRPPREHFV